MSSPGVIPRDRAESFWSQSQKLLSWLRLIMRPEVTDCDKIPPYTGFEGERGVGDRRTLVGNERRSFRAAEGTAADDENLIADISRNPLGVSMFSRLSFFFPEIFSRYSPRRGGMRGTYGCESFEETLSVRPQRRFVHSFIRPFIQDFRDPSGALPHSGS